MSTSDVTGYLAGPDEPLRGVGERVRAIVEAALPGAGAAVWHGHPVWRLGDRPGRQPVRPLTARQTHLAFGLWRGREVAGPSGRLTPGARQMASVRLRGLGDVDAALCGDWLGQAPALESGEASPVAAGRTG